MSDRLAYTVRYSADDAMEEDGGSLTLTDSSINMGDNSGSFSCGFRFRNINIPAGATIDNAYIELYSEANGSPTLNIYAEDADNPAEFEDDTGLKVLDRTLTTEFVAWDSTWTSSEEYKQSPDISDVIQEVIDRSGWKSGNSIVIIVKDDSSSSEYATVSTFDGNTNQSAILTIQYSGVSSDDKSISGDKKSRNITGKRASVELLQLYVQTESASFTLENGEDAVVTATLSNDKGLRLFANSEVSLFDGSVSAANLIGGGSAVDETDFIWEIWDDYYGSDGNNFVSRAYILNQSGGQKTIGYRVRFRFIVESAAI